MFTAEQSQVKNLYFRLDSQVMYCTMVRQVEPANGRRGITSTLATEMFAAMHRMRYLAIIFDMRTYEITESKKPRKCFRLFYGRLYRS